MVAMGDAYVGGEISRGRRLDKPNLFTRQRHCAAAAHLFFGAARYGIGGCGAVRERTAQRCQIDLTRDGTLTVLVRLAFLARRGGSVLPVGGGYLRVHTPRRREQRQHLASVRRVPEPGRGPVVVHFAIDPSDE